MNKTGSMLISRSLIIGLSLPLLICLITLNQAILGKSSSARGTPSSQHALIESPLASPGARRSKTEVHVFHPRPVMIGDASRYSPPDFSTFKSTEAKKQAFYTYLLPKIHMANQEVMFERKWLTALSQNLAQGIYPTDEELQALDRIEKRYAVKTNQFVAIQERLAAMLSRADIVPASLVIAQAAKESGWGTSRFALQGNNYFGIWCFTRDCGLTPRRRDNDRSHEVATFDSVEDGVRYYIRTINSHVAYADLRNMRATARRQDTQVYGDKLAKGLVSYSERGMLYVNEIRSMIQHNQLNRFTRIYSA